MAARKTGSFRRRHIRRRRSDSFWDGYALRSFLKGLPDDVSIHDVREALRALIERDGVWETMARCRDLESEAQKASGDFEKEITRIGKEFRGSRPRKKRKARGTEK